MYNHRAYTLIIIRMRVITTYMSELQLGCLTFLSA